jgi:N-hydroxyarylamine O-acetyltransferase
VTAAYLARIGWQGAPPTADLATLRRLVALHAAAIPFEGIDALLGRTPDLAPEAVATKLLGAPRGGWCFEQNGLLGRVLDGIGFRATPHLCRVVFGGPPDTLPVRTHLVQVVALPEGPHLADVGFGAITLTDVIPYAEGGPWSTPHGRVRLAPHPNGLLLQSEAPDGAWVDVYVIDPAPPVAADIEAANWLVANRPGGLFTANLVVSRAVPGERRTLLNRRLTIRRNDGEGTSARLEDAAALDAALREQFGIALPPEDAAALDAALAAERPGFIPT